MTKRRTTRATAEKAKPRATRATPKKPDRTTKTISPPDNPRDEIDFVLINDRTFSGFTEFRRGGITKSVDRLREMLADAITAVLPKAIANRFCALSFLRHVYSREIVPILLNAHDVPAGRASLTANYLLEHFQIISVA